MSITFHSMTTTPRIINTWDQNVAAGGERVALLYHAATQTGWKWRVYRWVDGRSIKTDPTDHWQNNGAKTFDGWDRPERGHAAVVAARLAAEAWVAETYGKRDFVRNPRGDYVEREVNERFPIPKPEKPHA